MLFTVVIFSVSIEVRNENFSPSDTDSMAESICIIATFVLEISQHNFPKPYIFVGAWQNHLDLCIFSDNSVWYKNFPLVTSLKRSYPSPELSIYSTWISSDSNIQFYACEIHYLWLARVASYGLSRELMTVHGGHVSEPSNCVISHQVHHCIPQVLASDKIRYNEVRCRWIDTQFNISHNNHFFTRLKRS